MPEPRKCGGLEQFSIYRNVLNMSTTVFVSGEYTKPLTKQWVYQALRLVVSQNWALGVDVAMTSKDGKTPPELRQFEAVDLDKVVCYRDIEMFEQLADEQMAPGHRFSYGASEPLWKFHILADLKKTAIVFDHSIMDGTSGALFHKSLLKALNECDPEADIDTTESVVKLSSWEQAPSKSVESYGHTNPPFMMLAKTVFGLVMEKFGYKGDAYLGPKPTSPPQSKTILLEIEPTRVTQLVKIARSKKVSMQSLLYGVLMRAIREHLAETTSEEYGSLSFSCPINARRFCGNNDEMGNYVYQYTHHLRFDEQTQENDIDKWAQEFHASLKQATQHPTAIAHSIGLLSKVNVKEYLQGVLDHGSRGSSSEISNLGTYNLGQGDKVAMTKLALVQPVTATGSEFLVSAASVTDGFMTLTVSCAADNDQKSKCHSIASRLSKLLEVL